MPNGNGTGPQGTGKMTGRGAGFCAGFETPGFMNGGVGAQMRGNHRNCRGGQGRNGRGRHGNRVQFMQTGLTGWQRGVRGAGVTVAVNQSGNRESLEQRKALLTAELSRVQELLKAEKKE